MTRIAFILIFLISKSAFCQTTFVVDNFSKDYLGKLYIADTTEVFSKGWVAVFDKKTKKQLIKISSDELTFTLHKGKVLAVSSPVFQTIQKYNFVLKFPAIDL